MSLFGSIMDKIVSYAGSVIHPSEAVTAPATLSPADAATSASPQGTGSGPAATPAPAEAVASAALRSVDVGAVLTALSERKGGGLNWQRSIVDLLKLLDLDSSLSARKELAQELDVHAGADGSAEENMALHRAVVSKLEENGGSVPASMRH